MSLALPLPVAVLVPHRRGRRPPNNRRAGSGAISTGITLAAVLLAVIVVVRGTPVVVEPCPPQYCPGGGEAAHVAITQALAAYAPLTCTQWVGRWTYARPSVLDPGSAAFTIADFCRALVEGEASATPGLNPALPRPPPMDDVVAACVASLAPHVSTMGWAHTAPAPLEWTAPLVPGTNNGTDPGVALITKSVRGHAFSPSWRWCLRVYTRAAAREERARRLFQ